MSQLFLLELEDPYTHILSWSKLFFWYIDCDFRSFFSAPKAKKSEGGACGSGSPNKDKEK